MFHFCCQSSAQDVFQRISYLPEFSHLHQFSDLKACSGYTRHQEYLLKYAKPLTWPIFHNIRLLICLLAIFRDSTQAVFNRWSRNGGHIRRYGSQPSHNSEDSLRFQFWVESSWRYHLREKENASKNQYSYQYSCVLAGAEVKEDDSCGPRQNFEVRWQCLLQKRKLDSLVGIHPTRLCFRTHQS